VPAPIDHHSLDDDLLATRFHECSGLVCSDSGCRR
jgi:hypothetical protein